LLYQEDVKNLVAAESILKKAIKVLRKYYDKLEKRMAAEVPSAIKIFCFKGLSFVQFEMTGRCLLAT